MNAYNAHDGTLQPRSTRCYWWNLPLCVAITALNGACAFVMPVMMPLWKENGLTTSDIWLLEGIFAITFAIFQLPTGYMADALGRKRSLLVGCCILVIGHATYGLSASFMGFLVGEVLLGMGLACIAGADSALLFDTLLLRNEEKRHTWWAGLGSALFFGMSACGNALGGHIGELEHRMVFAAAGVGAVLQLLLVLLVKEPVIHSTDGLVRISELRSVVRFAFVENRDIRWLLLASCVVGTSVWIAIWFFPQYLDRTGWETREHGYVFAGFAIVAGMASFGTRWIGASKDAAFKLFPLFAVATATAHLLIGLFEVRWGFMFGFLHHLCRGSYQVVFSTALNERIPSRIRATVLSLQGALLTLAYGLVSLRLGWLIERVGFNAVLLLLGTTTLVATALLLRRSDPQTEQVPELEPAVGS